MSFLLLILRIIWIIVLEYDLYSEEAQYWLWSRHLDLSYYSKPPLIAYFNFISSSVFGNSELGVRINAVIIGFILPVIVYRFSLALFNDERIAYFAAVILMVMPFYHVISIVFTTDSLIVLFWTLSFYYLYLAIIRGKITDWMFAGIFSGLAVMSKYTGVLFFLVILLYAIIFRKELFREPGFYYLFIIAAVICSPMIIWIILHEWVSVKHVLHQTGEGAHHTSLAHAGANLLEYIGGQILSLSPFLVVPALWLYFRKGSTHKTDEKDKNKLVFLMLPVLLTWIIFFFISFGRVEVNWLYYTYSLFAIVMSYIFLRKNRIGCLRWGSGVTLGLMILFLNPNLLDAVKIGSIYPPEIDTLSRLKGWSRLGNEVNEFLDDLPENEVFVFSDSYHIASQLAFYVKDHPTTYCINSGRRMNQFDLWEGIERFEHSGRSAIFVSTEEASPDIKDGFMREINHEVLKIYYRTSLIKQYHIYLFSGFKKITNQSASEY